MIQSFKFSVVIPAYNVEPYIAEAIESVIAQDIGFQNIQLILVDDGSTDGTGAVIDRYAQKYPDNIIALHQKSSNFFAATSEGLSLATGKYISFLEADGKYSTNTCSKVFPFFEKNFNKIDVVSCPSFAKEKSNISRFLNDKSKKGSRVILLDKEANVLLRQNGGMFFKREIVSEELRQKDVFISEYCRRNYILCQILMHRQTLGVVSACRHEHRDDKNPLMDNALKLFFTEYMDHLKSAVRTWIETHGYLPRFVQNVLFSNLNDYLAMPSIDVDADLTPDEEMAFRKNLHEMLTHVDDDLILSCRYLNFQQKLHILGIKHARLPSFDYLTNDIILNLPSGKPIMRLSQCPIWLDFLNAEDGCLILEGRLLYYTCLPDKEIKITLSADNGKTFPAEITEKFGLPRDTSLGNQLCVFYVFKAQIPLSSWHGDLRLQFFLNLNGINIKLPNLSPQNHFPLTKKYRKSYCIRQRVKITLDTDAIILAKKYSRLKDELRLIKEIWQIKAPYYKKVIFVRTIYNLLSPLLTKPIWLLSDRQNKAGDNAEALMSHLVKKHKNIRPYFVLEKNSDDWDRLKNKFNLVDPQSMKYKILIALCRCIITSHIFVNSWRNCEGIRDIMSEKPIIFLQHGITQNNVGYILKRQVRNFSGFVTSATREYRSILDGNYGYSPKQVWLTGFPRYDLLEDAKKKLIVIAPTWRQYEQSKNAAIHHVAPPRSDFQARPFCTFYSNLLSDERLITAAKRFGYKLAFFPHPELIDYVDLFRHDPSVEILDRETSYRDIFKISSLLITDYSSVAFDFAYLHKPIVYTQFDVEQFFSKHYLKGYFDYVRDGFGEVEYDLDSTVDRIIEYMGNGCLLKDEYRKRIDTFFAFHDRQCCERVFAKIAEIAG